jgi:hypothetical protein
MKAIIFIVQPAPSLRVNFIAFVVVVVVVTSYPHFATIL